jgi:hypothetical protein
MSAATSEALARQLRVRGYHQTSADLALVAHAALGSDDPSPSSERSRVLWAAFVRAMDGVLDASDPLRQQAPVDPSGAVELGQIEQAHDALTVAYNALKAQWLAEAASGVLPLNALDTHLHRAAALRDAAVHATKASRWSWQRDDLSRTAV